MAKISCNKLTAQILFWTSFLINTIVDSVRRNPRTSNASAKEIDAVITCWLKYSKANRGKELAQVSCSSLAQSALSLSHPPGSPSSSARRFRLRDGGEGVNGFDYGWVQYIRL